MKDAKKAIGKINRFFIGWGDLVCSIKCIKNKLKTEKALK
jgi:hypothetical protein